MATPVLLALLATSFNAVFGPPRGRGLPRPEHEGVDPELVDVDQPLLDQVWARSPLPRRIVEGRLRGQALEESPEATAEEAMEIGPTTIRPNESLEPLVERMHKRGVRTIVVSDLKGRLVGILHREDAERALERAAGR